MSPLLGTEEITILRGKITHWGTRRFVATTSTLALALVLALASLINAEGSSIVGTYSDGYEQGKKAGQSDYEGGSEHNSKCPPNDSLSWCTGFKVGYETGWVAAATLGD